jgi:hypothetical protein
MRTGRQGEHLELGRRLHNEEPSPHIKLRRMKLTGCRTLRRSEKYIHHLGRRAWGKKRLERPRHIWGDNIKMDLREIWWEIVDWIQLVQNRDRWRAVVNMIMDFRVP